MDVRYMADELGTYMKKFRIYEEENKRECIEMVGTDVRKKSNDEMAKEISEIKKLGGRLVKEGYGGRYSGKIWVE